MKSSRPQESRSQGGVDINQVDRPELPTSRTEPPAANEEMLLNGVASSAEWFTKLGFLQKVIRAKRKQETDEEYELVRVAVLDTGIGEDVFQKYTQNIQDYRDFVSHDHTLPTDTSKYGHGTHMVDELVIKTFKKADIYVSRVLEDEDLRHVDVIKVQKRIKDAVKYTTKTWEMDVMAMGVGLENQHDGMRDAVRSARNKDILVFAPASNMGNLTGIAFPARLHHDALCMFSMDARAKISHSLNPQPSRHRRYNLALFGEQVQLHEDGTLLSGTSISTAIAAGLAAHLLDFSRHVDSREILMRDEEALRTMEGMESVFVRMARGGSDDGYYCVAPWSLLEGIDTDLDRKSRRSGLCHANKAAVRDRNY